MLCGIGLCGQGVINGVEKFFEWYVVLQFRRIATRNGQSHPSIGWVISRASAVTRARSFYRAQVSIPAGTNDTDVMEVESPVFAGPAPRPVRVDIKLDGLLLYVVQAIL